MQENYNQIPDPWYESESNRNEIIELSQNLLKTNLVKSPIFENIRTVVKRIVNSSDQLFSNHSNCQLVLKTLRDFSAKTNEYFDLISYKSDESTKNIQIYREIDQFVSSINTILNGTYKKPFSNLVKPIN